MTPELRQFRERLLQNLTGPIVNIGQFSDAELLGLREAYIRAHCRNARGGDTISADRIRENWNLPPAHTPPPAL